MPENLENSAVAIGLEKVSFFIPVPMKGIAKKCSNCCTVVLILHASKVMLKILQLRLNSTWTEAPDVQAEFKKAEEPEIKLPASVGSSKKQESSRKDIYFCFIDYAKAFDCVDHS